MKVMLCVCLANGEDGPAGQYLAEYDNQTGESAWTDDLAKAMRFEDGPAALECWRQVHARDPVRPWDGKPNRPLTAFTVTIEEAPEKNPDSA